MLARLILGLTLLGSISIQAQNSISLANPSLRACGRIEIGGGFTAPGLQHVPPSWSWGDGTTSESFFPATHTYAANRQYTITASVRQQAVVLASASVVVTISTAGGSQCGNLLVVEPPQLALRDGRVSRQLTVTHIAPDGSRSVLAPGTLSFSSQNPAIAQVSSSGLVSSSGFGNTLIEVLDPSTGRVVRVPVEAGDFRLEPPYLRLTLGRQPEAQIRAVVTNADGSPVNTSGRNLTFLHSVPPPQDPVISLSPQGLVRGLRLPRTFSENQFVTATLDGVGAANNVVVRVADFLPDLSFVDLSSGRTRFRIASKVGEFDYLQILTDAQAARITDLSLFWQEAAAGLHVSRQGQRALVNDVGGSSDPNDPTVPCGLSGNPTLLGTGPAKQEHNSCLIVAARPPNGPLPQWFIYFHEIGHDNTLSSARFSQFGTNAASSRFAFIFNEAFASTLGIYSAEAIRLNANHYQIPAQVLQEFSLNQLNLDSFRWTNALRDYEAKGAAYATLDPDVLTAIIVELMREEGLDWYARLHSAFLQPNTPYDFKIEGEAEASTALIAALSAAIGKDLRDRFTNRWNFPFSSTAYERLYPVMRQLTRQRQTTLTAQGITRAASYQAGPIAPASWVALFGEHLAPRFFMPAGLTQAAELTSVTITDRNGLTKPATLQFVSPNHINILMPDNLASGPGRLQVRTWLGSTELPIEMQPVAPALFTANASGSGLAAATWLRVLPDGTRTEGFVSTEPLDLSAGQLYLSFYGSGIRNQTSASVRIGGSPVPVLGALAQGQFAGLDQVVVGPLPNSLAGRGEVLVESQFDSLPSNPVLIIIR